VRGKCGSHRRVGDPKPCPFRSGIFAIIKYGDKSEQVNGEVGAAKNVSLYIYLHNINVKCNNRESSGRRGVGSRVRGQMAVREGGKTDILLPSKQFCLLL
jgi:hypothetical protein